jgi:Cft2 family RNA processing exonuclease
MQDSQHKELTIQFLGATNTVTGSRYLIAHQGRRVLVDCGLFQGYKQLRLKNWAAPFSPHELAGVVLSHAHLDHSGYLPVLVKRGFRGPIFATAATFELCQRCCPTAAFSKRSRRDSRTGTATRSTRLHCRSIPVRMPSARLSLSKSSTSVSR